VWGSTFLASKIAVRELPPFLFGGIRFCIAGVLLFAIARALGRRVRLDRRALAQAAVMALCSVLISNCGNLWGLQWVPSNQAALLNTSSAFWIVCFAMFGAQAHRLRLTEGLGLAVGLIGTALIVYRSGSAVAVPLAAQLAILVGCLGWAAGTTYLRNAAVRMDILSFTSLQMLLGGVMMVAVGLAAGEARAWHVSAPGFGAMAYLVVFSSCLAYTAYAWLARNVSPAAVGTYGYVNPAIATLLGWLVLGERLTLLQVCGMCVTLTGVILVSRPAGEAAPEAPG
jgi:drug/metabolite transporter (DMT)-like permease